MIHELDHIDVASALEQPSTEWAPWSPGLSAEESRLLDELGAERPELVTPFLESLERGRRGILRRMLQAAVRENIAGVGGRICWNDGGQTLRILLSDGRSLVAERVRRLSLNRFDVLGPVKLVTRQAAVPVEHPCQLLDLLRQEGLVGDDDPEARQRFEGFQHELDNSAANLALSFVGADLRRRALLRRAAVLGARDSVDYVARASARDPSFSPLAFYEQWVVEGHPLHPCTRMKLGMGFVDVIENAPEWGATPEVRLVAVARSACRVFSRVGDGAAAVLFREYPNLKTAAARSLSVAGQSLDDYELIPVHPWQMANTIPRLHAEAIARGEVVPIEGAVIPTTALVSVRSLAPVQLRGEGKHHLKTAINVHMTSAVRTVSANAAENGPRLSSVLEEISEREGGFAGTFVILSEDVGVHYQPGNTSVDPERSSAQIKHLAALLRENPENHVGEGQMAMPAAALTAESPFGRWPIAAELIDAMESQQGLQDRRAAAVAFIRRYAEISVPAFLTLMTRYGIALEGHMQNSVCVFQAGRPVRMLVRDLGAVRILPERLASQGIPLELVPGSAVLADDLDDLQNKVYYSFFQNHLAELIAAIVRHSEIDETSLWHEVTAVVLQTFSELKADVALRERAEVDESALFRPCLALKALATMRLRGDVTDYTFRSVPNPLAACLTSSEGEPGS
jgi:siderophore synthetase component